MVSDEPKVTATSRYSVEETSTLLGVNKRTLYRYTASGKIRCGYRRVSGRRFYFGSEILRCWKSQI